MASPLDSILGSVLGGLGGGRGGKMGGLANMLLPARTGTVPAEHKVAGALGSLAKSASA